MTDVRDILFREIAEKKFRAVLTAERSGVFAGKSAAITCAQALGIELEICKMTAMNYRMASGLPICWQSQSR